MTSSKTILVGTYNIIILTPVDHYFQFSLFLILHSTFSLGSFKDKVVWITGASSGIGEQLALNLSKHGAKLVLSARSQDKLYQVKNQCIGNLKKI